MRTLFAGLCALLVVTAVRGAPPPWPQFRGPGGSGVAEGQQPPTDCSDRNLAWKVPVPSGISSPVVVADRLFLTAFDQGKLYTLAYRSSDGKELWRREAPAKTIESYHKTDGSPATSTPVTDGERVVSYFGSCGLICHDLDGKELWRYEMPCAKTNNGFGSGTSPVIADGLVLLVRDMVADSRVIAVDLKSGAKVWEKPRTGFRTAYSTPCVWDGGAGKELVTAGALRIISYDVKTGDERWSYSGIAAQVCASPVTADGLLLYAGSTSGETDHKMPTFDDLLKTADPDKDGVLTWAEWEKLAKTDDERESVKGFFDANDTNKDGKLTRDEWDAMARFFAKGKDVALAIRPGGKGVLSDKQVAWTQTKGLPNVPTALAYRGRLFLLDAQGLASAYDVKTGETVFQLARVPGLGGRGCYASPVAANGHVYLCPRDGRLLVLEAGDRVKVVSRADLGESVSATPAIANDTLYVRTDKHLHAFAQKQ